MDPKYAILRVEKIKDWSSFTRQLDHAERTGRILPANVDKNRQRWNQRLFPEAPGTDHAKERWTARLGKQRVRRNAVLAVEVFMGMSDGTAMPYKKQLVQQVASS